MAIVIKPITLEVSKPNVFQAIAAKQGDSNSRFLKATIVNEGVMIPVLSTSTVVINAKRNDGQSNSFFGETNEDGTATVPVHSWMLELVGYVNCDVSIIDTQGRKLTTTSFTLLVEEASNNGSDMSETEQYDFITEVASMVSKKADIDVVANAIKNTASGSVVSLTDISPTEHILRVKARSKNLIPYPYVDTPKTGNTVENAGITYTDNGDGTITADGTATGNADFLLSNSVAVKKGMSISGSPDGSTTSTFEIQVYKSGDEMISTNGYESSTAIVDFAGGARIRIREGYTANNLVFKPQLEVGSATEYTPFVADISTVNLIKSGKNLAQVNSVSAPLTDNVTIFEGEISGDFVLSCDKSNLKDIVNGTASLFRWTLKDGTQGYSARVDYLTDVKISGVLTKIELLNYCAAKSGSVDKIQLEVGTTKTEFEPFKELKSHTINADGTVEGVTSIYPTTALTTDTEGVVLDVEYNADTKKYIDNKFAELATAMINK